MDDLTEFAQPYIHTDVWSVLCQFSTTSGFFLLEGNLSKRFTSSRSYHQRCTSEIASPSSSYKIPFSENELDQVLFYNMIS